MIKKLFKKIPYIKNKLSILNPSIESILNNIFKKHENLIILDVGANIGQSIDFFSKLYPNSKIYSFEPDTSLIKNLQLKLIRYNNVTLFPYGLGDSDGKSEFYISKNHATNSFLKANISQYKKFNSSLAETLQNSIKNTAELKKLDTWYFDCIKDKKIDIIKIDVQGFEYQVISGGINTLKEYTKLLYFEIQYLDFYEDTIPFYKIYEKLYELGFYYYCQINSIKQNKYQIIESDVFFINGKYIQPFSQL